MQPTENNLPPENKQPTEIKISTEACTERDYIHKTCGRETTVAGLAFCYVVNPFRLLSQTYCSACGKVDLINFFNWSDTGEDVIAYRKRVFRAVPGFLKLLIYLILPVVFGVIFSLVLYILHPFIMPVPKKNAAPIDPMVLMCFEFALGFMIWYALLMLTPISTWVARNCGVDFRKYI